MIAVGDSLPRPYDRRESSAVQSTGTLPSDTFDRQSRELFGRYVAGDLLPISLGTVLRDPYRRHLDTATQHLADHLRKQTLWVVQQHIRAYEANGRLNYHRFVEPSALRLEDTEQGEILSWAQLQEYWSMPQRLGVSSDLVVQWFDKLRRSDAVRFEDEVMRRVLSAITTHIKTALQIVERNESPAQFEHAQYFLGHLAMWVADGTLACYDRAVDAYDRMIEQTHLYRAAALPIDEKLRVLLLLGIAWAKDQLLGQFVHPRAHREKTHGHAYMRMHLRQALGLAEGPRSMTYHRHGAAACAYSLPRVIELFFNVWSTRSNDDGTWHSGVDHLAQQLAHWLPWQEFIRAFACDSDSTADEIQIALGQFQQAFASVPKEESKDLHAALGNAFGRILQGVPEAADEMTRVYAQAAHWALAMHGYVLSHDEAIAERDTLLAADRQTLPTPLAPFNIFLDDELAAPSTYQAYTARDFIHRLQKTLSHTGVNINDFPTPAEFSLFSAIVALSNWSVTDVERVLMILRKHHYDFSTEGTKGPSAAQRIVQFATKASDAQELLEMVRALCNEDSNRLVRTLMLRNTRIAAGERTQLLNWLAPDLPLHRHIVLEHCSRKSSQILRSPELYLLTTLYGVLKSTSVSAAVKIDITHDLFAAQLRPPKDYFTNATHYQTTEAWRFATQLFTAVAGQAYADGPLVGPNNEPIASSIVSRLGAPLSTANAIVLLLDSRYSLECNLSTMEIALHIAESVYANPENYQFTSQIRPLWNQAQNDLTVRSRVSEYINNSDFPSSVKRRLMQELSLTADIIEAEDAAEPLTPLELADANTYQSMDVDTLLRRLRVTDYSTHALCQLRGVDGESIAMSVVRHSTASELAKEQVLVHLLNTGRRHDDASNQHLHMYYNRALALDVIDHFNDAAVMQRLLARILELPDNDEQRRRTAKHVARYLARKNTWWAIEPSTMIARLMRRRDWNVFDGTGANHWLADWPLYHAGSAHDIVRIEMRRPSFNPTRQHLGYPLTRWIARYVRGEAMVRELLEELWPRAPLSRLLLEISLRFNSSLSTEERARILEALPHRSWWQRLR